MNDKQLVDFAAKACGFEVLRDELNYPWRSDKPHEVFDPLHDGNDAIYLVVTLNLSVLTGFDLKGQPHQGAATMLGAHEDLRETHVPYGDNPAAAWRRSVTIAAAKMGEAKDGN